MIPPRVRTVTLHNLAPLAWPVLLWGISPAAVLAALALLAASYVWNAFVLAGALVLLNRADSVGQKGLLRGAMWLTLAGAAAEASHHYLMTGLLGRVDLLLAPDPTALFLSTLSLPALIIFTGGFALAVASWRLSGRHALFVAVWACALTAPWLSLLLYDSSGIAVPIPFISSIILILALSAAVPWLLLLAAAWARYRSASQPAAVTTVALGVAAALAFLGAGAIEQVAPASPLGLPGSLCVSIQGRLYIMNAATGDRSLLASDPSAPMAWSPDATRIITTRTISATTWIQVMNATDGAVTRLAQGRADSASWSADSAALLYVTDRPAPQDGVVWLARPGQAPIRLVDGSAASWSPDGRRVAYSARVLGRPQIWVVTPDGADPIQLTTDGGEDPAWSPDGRFIAYAFNGRVFLMNADGTGRRQVTTGEELFDRNPVLTWSPNGSSLAYAEFQPPQAPRRSSIYVVAADNFSRTRLTGEYEPPLQWSPDSQWLAIVRQGEVWAVQLAGGQWRRLSPGISFAWGGARPPVAVRPVPAYPPTPTPTPLPAAVMQSPDALLASAVNTTTTLYAGTPQGVMRRVEGAGWGNASQGMAYPLRVRALAMDPAKPSVLYAGTDGERSQTGGALYKSIDGGLRWTKTRLRDLDIYAIAVDPASPDTVYAGTLTGVFKSSDGGATWRAANTGLKTPAVQALAIDPTPPKGGPPAASQVIYAGTRQGDLYRSADAAATWTLVESRDSAVTAIALKPGQTSVAYASTADGLLRSTDSGAHWSLVAGGIWRYKLDGVVVDPKNAGVVYAVGPGGVFKSSDGGENWGPASVGLLGTQPTALAIDPRDSQVLYLGTDKGMFRSAHGAIYWER
jgi:hypothetical protein